MALGFNNVNDVTTLNKLLTMPAEHFDVFYDIAMQCGSVDYFLGVLGTIGRLRRNPIETTRMNLDIPDNA